MVDETERLAILCRGWELWAVSANRDEDGWQTDYPAWEELLATAQAVMVQPALGEATLRDRDLCWAISEEDEPFVSYAQEHLEQCWAALHALAQSGRPDTRWQVFAALGAASGNTAAEAILRLALDDADSYCRRRALLSLAHFKPADAKELAARFLGDDDPYLRQSAIEMVRVSDEERFVDSSPDDSVTGG
jgi:hypothetical protein